MIEVLDFIESEKSINLKITKKNITDNPELLEILPNESIISDDDIIFNSLQKIIKYQIAISYLIIYDFINVRNNIYFINSNFQQYLFEPAETTLEISQEVLIDAFKKWCVDTYDGLDIIIDAKPRIIKSEIFMDSEDFRDYQLDAIKSIKNIIKNFFSTTKGALPFDAIYGSELKKYLHTKDVDKIREVAADECLGLLESIKNKFPHLDINLIDINFDRFDMSLKVKFIFEIAGQKFNYIF